jgi:hypothetical protein
MGQEIFYCFNCQTQLRTADFERGSAFRIESRVVCTKCSKSALELLPPEKVQALLQAAATTPETRRIQSAAPSRSSTTAIPQIRNPRSPGMEPSTLGLVLGGVGIIGAALLVLLSAAGGHRNERPAPAERSSPPTVELPALLAPDPAASPAIPVPSSAPPGGLAKEKELAARASLQKAQEHERRSPQDIEGQQSLYEQARWDSRGTPVEEEATRAFETFQRKQRDRLGEETARLETALEARIGKQEFKEAFRVLDEASAPSAQPAWKEVLDRKRKELEAKVQVAYAFSRAQALDAQHRGALSEVAAVREKVGQWGMTTLTADLERALAEEAAPKGPSGSAEAVGYEKTWRRAMTLSSARAYGDAARELEGAVRDFREAAVKSEAVRDLDLLRGVASVTQEALGALAKAPKGQKTRLEFWDEAGQPRTVEGVIQKADGLEVEIKMDQEMLLIPTGELLPGTLAELFRSRPARRPAADEAVLSLFLLGEGEASLLKEPPSGAEGPAAKVRQWAQTYREAAAAPDRLKRESEARALFYAAQRDRATYVGEADAVLKCRTLQKDYADSAFVRRNQGLLQRRASGAREFVFSADDVVGAGTFKLEISKAGSAWVSASDSDPGARKANYVEFQFSALEDVSYRCWVYVGGCCAENLAFSVQGSEMKGPAPNSAGPGPAAEPGGEFGVSVKHSVGSVVKSHASHGTGKKPMLWGWAEIPLPKYSSSGAKALRVLTDHQGFSVKGALVSSMKQEPPGEAELRDMEKARLAATLATARAAGNFIKDPSFKLQTQGNGNPLIAPWSGTGPATIGLDSNNGNGPRPTPCGYISSPAGTGWSAITQRVSVAPHTNYELSVSVQTCMGFPGGVCGVRTLGGTVLGQKAIVVSEGYQKYSVTFNSGPNGSVTVFAGFVASGTTDGWIHLGDCSLVER